MTEPIPPARILAVDDEITVRYFLEKLLTRDGHQVVAVDSGEAALDHIAAEEFDLALIDLKLKGMGGMEVLAALRQKSPATAVIVLTAHASLETAVEALRQGAHDYLFKPCATVDLRQSVRAGLLKRWEELQRRELLQRAESSTPRPVGGVHHASETPPSAPQATHANGRFLQYQGLIVDPIRHLVTLDGALLELSPTEFGLLAYLVSEAPRVVSAGELVREVQSYPSDAWTASDLVRSHIYHMRRKIKAAAGRDVIRTVRGVGYTIGD